MICAGFNSLAQINVNNTGSNADPNWVAQNVIAGSGLTMSNVTFQGVASQQIGTFTDGSSFNIFESGAILATGNVNIAEFSNVSGSTTSPGFALGSSNDPDLLLLSGSAPLTDPAILEFDIVVLGDELHLEFVFASEEYPEYVCSDLSDVVGVFVSGPGISGPFSGGAVNMTLVPGTNENVGINSINIGSPGSFGSPTGCGANGLGNAQYFVENQGQLIEFDGYTVPLNGVVGVQCNQTYHVKIALAEVNGFNSESALLINRGGLYSNAIDLYRSGLHGDSAVVEGCRADTIYFTRPVTGFPQQINLNITGTAINGFDYEPIIPQINFASADSIAYLVIDPIGDNLTEGPEDVIIDFSLTSPCGTVSDYQFVSWILDSIPIEVDFEDYVEVCAGEPVILSASASGFYGPYDYRWGTVWGNNLTIFPTTSTTVDLAVYDNAGCDFYGSVDIEVHPMPIVDAGLDRAVCQNETVTLGALIDGGPDAEYVWTPDDYLEDPNVPYARLVKPVITTTYTITVTTPEGCEATDDIKIFTKPAPVAEAGPNQTIVYFETQADLSTAGSSFGLYSWYPDDHLTCSNCSNPVASPPIDTWYYLSVASTNGCYARDSMLVNVKVPTDVFIPTGFSPNGDGHNDSLFVRGYTISYMSFQVYDKWGGKVFESSDPNVGWDGNINGMPASQGTYTYTCEVVFVNDVGTLSLGGEITLVR